jgi:uncharacterized membrane protein
MVDQSTQSIVVDAPASAIMAVIADFDAYPQWAASVRSAVVTEPGEQGRARRVAFVIDAGPVRDEYELTYSWDDDRGVAWHLVAGQIQRSQVGSYALTERGGATEVTYSLTVELAIPMLGMLRRRAEKVIMDTALKELKKRVEGLGDR